MNDDLKANWARIAAHLEAAFSALPASPSEAQHTGSLTQFKEFLAHNELALALDELEALGVGNAVPAEFWSRLGSAAEAMGLSERAFSLRQRGAAGR